MEEHTIEEIVDMSVLAAHTEEELEGAFIGTLNGEFYTPIENAIENALIRIGVDMGDMCDDDYKLRISPVIHRLMEEKRILALNHRRFGVGLMLPGG